MINTIILLFLIAMAIKWFIMPVPYPVYHIYSKPRHFYYLKYISYFFVSFYMKLKNQQARKSLYGVLKKFGQALPAKSEKLSLLGFDPKLKYDQELMECIQPLSGGPKAFDSVYFQGANSDGVYFVASATRRPHHVINGFVLLQIPDEGLLLSPKLPDSTMYAKDDEFGAEGLTFEPLVPMRKWSIKYRGQLRRSTNEELVDVEIDAVWSSDLSYFHFDSDKSLMATTRAIAREPWSREYFQGLRESHHTHYEQMGNIDGTITVADKKYNIQVESMRNHSYGKRKEWKLLHRYAFHTLALQDGTRINVGVVCQPCTFSVCEMGYVYLPDGRLFPVTECNLNMWNIGENGTPPTDYFFSFKAANRTWDIQVNVIDSPVFYVGWEWEAKIIERMCTFQVNGIPGWGTSEFMYRNMNGRPKEWNDRDPEWTRAIVKG